MPFRYMNHGGGGHGLLAILFLVVVVVAIIWIASSLLHERDRRHHIHSGHGAPPVGATSNATSPDAMRILDERLARGDIDADDYQKRRELLRSQP